MGGLNFDDFYPRSPRGERRARLPACFVGAAISIHAPRVGSDIVNKVSSTSKMISIHAPRVGSDPDTLS